MRFVEQNYPNQQSFAIRRSGRAMKQFAVGTFLTALLCLLLQGMALAQTNFTTISTFLAQGDGLRPIGDLAMDSQGVLYGVATDGGSIFQMTPPPVNGGSWIRSTIYHGKVPGAPVGEPIQPVILGKDGALYGTSQNCVPSVGAWFGCVFQLVNSGGGWSMHVLYYFQGAAQADGRGPVRGRLVADAKGNLYGVTGSGGISDASDAGTVYQLAPPPTPGGAWTETVLYRFNHNRGGFYNPKTGLAIDQNGALYGATAYGGLQGKVGAIYQLVPPIVPGGSWTLNVIDHAIGGGFFTFVSQMIAASSGALYGVSSFAGGAFELAPPLVPGGTWTVNPLPAPGGCVHGCELAMDKNGALYGVGGQTVYKLTPPPTPGGAWTYSLLHTFIGGSEGSFPFGRPTIDSSGHVFGTTLAGGIGKCGGNRPGCGTVWELQ